MASLLSPTKELKVGSTKGPNWLELPLDLTANILQRLGIVDIVTSVCLVCPLWWNIHKDPLMWRSIDMRNNDLSHDSSYVEKICIYAVERSCGLLEDIHIDWFASDDLLKCIANRACHLRRVSLVKCMTYSEKGFREFVEKLSMLEELSISYNNDIFENNLKDIGRFCPNLRRIEISKTLLFDHQLLGILDGCPLLEYLDVHDCDCWFLSRSLQKRCREQIKHLVFPSERKHLDDDILLTSYIDDDILLDYFDLI